jgi:hypothetical protein|tara:strand:+ start:236 stop:379 length:144 start_codon:yes stop_codon:yes gene_type:complete
LLQVHLASLQGELAAARQGVVDKDKAMKELKVRHSFLAPSLLRERSS